MDPARRRLLRNGEAVFVTAKAYDLLALLVASGGRMVPRDEIFDRLWPDTAVEDNNLSQQVHRLRRILGADSAGASPIRTVPNRGFQFVADVERIEAEILDAGIPAPLSASGASAGVWPVAPGGLVGRTADVETILALLRTESCLTLTGPGGVGKTRLAIEAGRRFAGEISAGARWVDVTQASRAADLVPLVARALGIADTGRKSLLARVRDWLADTDALIVFDNFEHLIAAAPMLNELRSTNSDARFLVTSRALLRVRGEREYVVPPLRWTRDSGAGEDEGLAPAVRLFLTRSGGLDTDGVAALCERLDGLPLAIELAAARAKYLPPASLLKRDRLLSILPAGPRDAPERQQTLIRTLEWSYGLLDAREQRALRSLTVFSGGFSTEAAAALLLSIGLADCEAGALDLVTALRDQSLVAFFGGHTSGRLRLLETVREFCLDLVTAAERRAIHAAHAEWVRAWLARETPALRTSADGLVMERLLPEHANLLGALHWCAQEGDAAGLVRLATDAAWFFHTANLFTEGRAWTSRAIDLAAGPETASFIDRRRLFAMDALLAFHTAEFGTTDRLAVAVLSSEECDFARGLVCALLAGLAAYAEGFDTARTRGEEALHVARALADPWLEGLASLMLAYASGMSGDHEGAYTRLRTAPPDLGFLSVWIAINTHFLEVVTSRLKDADCGFRRILRQHYGEYRPIRQLTGGLEGLAYICARRGDPERAALLMASADRWRRETAPLLPMWYPEHERALAGARIALADRFDQIWAEGAALTLDEALHLAGAGVVVPGPIISPEVISRPSP